MDQLNDSILFAQRRCIDFVVVFRFLLTNGRIAVRGHREAGLALSAFAEKKTGPSKHCPT